MKWNIPLFLRPDHDTISINPASPVRLRSLRLHAQEVIDSRLEPSLKRSGIEHPL